MVEVDAQLLIEVRRNVAQALAEDVGAGDLTAGLVPAGQRSKATVLCRQEAVLCGAAWFTEPFAILDPTATVQWHAADGDRLHPGQTVATIVGESRALLTAERTALNFLQLLSGTATATRRYVDAVAGTRAAIVDTRKTIPGLRLAQKYAVVAGGGTNHRIGLHDAVLVKENHIIAAGGIPAVLAALAGVSARFVQVEVETLDQLDTALEQGVTMILLDNMDLPLLRQAVARNNGRALLEASGGITLETVRAVAETGVDRISVGSLTKDVAAVDFSLRHTPA